MTRENFATFGKTIQDSSISLPGTLCKDLLHHYLLPAAKWKTHCNILLVLPYVVHLLLNRVIWIKQFSGLKIKIRRLTATTPKFNILLRGSRDGFPAKDFHRLRDNKGPTVTIIKVQESGN